MAELFANKYRIPSARLQSWNYANQGMYFVTICTKNREHYFGTVPAVETPCMASLSSSPPQPVAYTEIGKIAHSEWFKTIELRPDMNLQFGEFVVMPNHIHGIIMIGCDRDAMHGVSTTMHGVSMATTTGNQFAPQSKNLASIIRGYKSAVTTYARKNNIEFDWQSRYHDHIIRSEGAFKRISNYIKNNPVQWQKDRFNLQK